ncbi:MAG: citrate lyase acyl carrier protein [Synergistaceae bacterium]|jgi:citrate lyase subunit gamma (acyl carrier protein)|nr:citrate lyase acyl carrier protein [Synergistaceae bacterium]
MLERKAQAGTLESSDCLVMVEPSASPKFEYGGQNAAIYRRRVLGIIEEIAARYDGTASVRIEDHGAVEMTLRARIETAFERASGKE